MTGWQPQGRVSLEGLSAAKVSGLSHWLLVRPFVMGSVEVYQQHLSDLLHEDSVYVRFGFDFILSLKC